MWRRKTEFNCNYSTPQTSTRIGDLELNATQFGATREKLPINRARAQCMRTLKKRNWWGSAQVRRKETILESGPHLTRVWSKWNNFQRRARAQDRWNRWAPKVRLYVCANRGENRNETGATLARARRTWASYTENEGALFIAHACLEKSEVRNRSRY